MPETHTDSWRITTDDLESKQKKSLAQKSCDACSFLRDERRSPPGSGPHAGSERQPETTGESGARYSVCRADRNRGGPRVNAAREPLSPGCFLRLQYRWPDDSGAGRPSKRNSQSGSIKDRAG